MAAKSNPMTAPNLSGENQSMQMKVQIPTLKCEMTGTWHYNYKLGSEVCFLLARFYTAPI